MDDKYKTGFIVIGGLVIASLIICWIVTLVNKKEKYKNIETRQEINETNERYEIIPGTYQNQNASSPQPPDGFLDEPIIFLSNPQNIQAVEIDIVDVKKPTPTPEKMSTFCTCGGLIHQTCMSTEKRVNNYNKGLTEFAKLPNKGWTDIMPYDKWTEQPNYYKQHTNWADPMPYDIYQRR